MIVMWMAYACLVALLLGVAAHGVENVLRLSGRSGRWPWMGALVGSWILPLTALGRRSSGAPPSLLEVAERAPGGHAATAAGPGLLERGIDAVLAFPGRAGDLVGGLLARVPEALAAAGHGGWLDAAARWGPVLWIVTAGLALTLVAAAAGSLLRRSRDWPRRRVLGEPVRLSPDFGPAVVGVLNPRIVLPRWVLRLGRTPLRLILEHEREHRRSRDTLTLTLGGLAVLAAPWNLPLWWQLRRLRLAVEVDCDLRVLRRGVPPREYGALLVEMGERVGRVGVPATALAEQSSLLERRLRMMTEPRSKRTVWRAAGAAALTLGTVVVACETPAPTDVGPPAPEGEVTATVSERSAPWRYEFEAVELPTDPLIVLDGVVVEEKGLADLEALDVQRIEVVHGKAALEAYGERARNGVVLVTRKKAGVEPADPSGWIVEGRVEPTSPGATARFRERSEDAAGILRLRDAPADGGARPLVVVDGVIVGRGLPDLDPEDIERVEILKGPAAQATWEERGANGVVTVTTKGREGAGGSGL